MTGDPRNTGGSAPAHGANVAGGQFTTNSVGETEAVAAQLARTLAPGDCIALFGDLGAGKTQFTRGLASALGVDPRAVSSPTYMLLNIYHGSSLDIYHLDAYRTSGSDDLEAIGFTELLETGGVVIVEWAERVVSLLPPDRIEVRLETVSQSDRSITISRIKWSP